MLAIVLLAMRTAAVIAQCDFDSLRNVAHNIGFDVNSLQPCHQLIGQLEKCEGTEPQRLRNKLAYQAGLIELSLDEPLDALKTFETIEDQEDGYFSLAQRQLEELYVKFGKREKLILTEGRKMGHEFLLLDSEIQTFVTKNELPSLSVVTQILQICPWSLEYRILANDIYFRELAQLPDINTAQAIVANYEVVLDKHRRKLSITERRDLYYAISTLQLYVMSTAPTNVKKCINLDMDFQPCRDLSKIYQKFVKTAPPFTSMMDPDRYLVLEPYDANKVSELLLQDRKAFAWLGEQANNNLLALKVHFKKALQLLLDTRPLSKMPLKLSLEPPSQGLDLTLNVLLCDAFSSSAGSTNAKRPCNEALKQALSKESFEILSQFLTTLSKHGEAYEIIQRLWLNYPPVAARAVQLLLQTLLRETKRKPNADLTNQWSQIENFAKERHWASAKNEKIVALFRAIQKGVSSSRQRQNNSFRSQQQQQFFQGFQGQRRGPGPSKFYGKDYYKALGVNQDADDKEVRRAYLELAKKNHPDKQGQSANVEEKMAAINEAYEILGDNDKRREYDMHRNEKGHVLGNGPFGQGGGSWNFQFQF
ncbi:LAMI_0H14642g1_1 [Lachancea mirantina]|uniref:LAMI_0H14642g1_1 n=1 Tax=Lachancea mirantina TaxID=1230905 RepID=A0A1G4KIC4_9SACH|nr:LAMI_0H14642g1_1 [Lachancea mirantina]